jgi:hypothetical protein
MAINKLLKRDRDARYRERKRSDENGKTYRAARAAAVRKSKAKAKKKRNTREQRAFRRSVNEYQRQYRARKKQALEPLQQNI